MTEGQRFWNDYDVADRMCSDYYDDPLEFPTLSEIRDEAKNAIIAAIDGKTCKRVQVMPISVFTEWGTCSECGDGLLHPEAKYCPTCGARISTETESSSHSPEDVNDKCKKCARERTIETCGECKIREYPDFDPAFD